METEKIKKQNDKAKGGKNNTQSILTSAGAVTAGGIVGAVAENALSPDSNSDSKTEPDKDSNLQSTAENKQEAEVTESPETVNPEIPDTPENPDTPDTPDTPGTNHPEPQNPESQTPDEIAQAIIDKDQIDENDIDAPDVVSIESFTTVFDENGNELAAANVRTPDGTQYVLADLDDDGIYEGILNTDGYLVAHAEANLTHSDLEAMINSDGGYLALNEQDKTSMIDDPTGDIIITDADQSPDMAQNDEDSSEDSDIDNLIAQLLNDDDSDSSDGDEVIVDDDNTDDTDDEDDSDDDDSDNDSDIDDDGDLA